MTGLEAEEQALQVFKAGWEALHPQNAADPAYVPWTTRNEPFTTDDLGELAAWARIVVISTTSEQVTHGKAPNRKIERRGRVMVQLFAAVNHVKSDATVITGDVTVKQLVEDVLKVLECQRSGGLNIYEGEATPLPEDGVWNAYVVVFVYRITDQR